MPRIPVKNDSMGFLTSTAVATAKDVIEQSEHLAPTEHENSLLEVAAGLARLKVERIVAVPVAPAGVFAQLERDRKSGRLAQSLSGAGVRFQASKETPGALERIAVDGAITVGTFENGEFIAMPASAGSTSATQA